jgi:hypothetical protein
MKFGKKKFYKININLGSPQINKISSSLLLDLEENEF